MGIIIDIIIILFILASIFLGYKKGLVSLGINLVAFIIAIIITFILYRPIANFIINVSQIDENLQQTIETNIEEIISNDENKGIVEDTTNSILQGGSRTLAVNIIYGITMIVLFVIARICLVFISAIANMISKLPILNQFNKLGGIVYGLLRGVIIIYVILMVVNLIIALNPTSKIKDNIEQTYLAKTMCEYNILSVFFNK